MTDFREELNRFLVEAFHSVLRYEERFIRQAGFSDLSISEMHVIEAVCRAQQDGSNTVGSIAGALGITAGSLSASVKVLEKKGYLNRRREEADRRLVTLWSTQMGDKADEGHKQIHRVMVEDILSRMTGSQAAALIQALRTVSAYFSIERTEET